VFFYPYVQLVASAIAAFRTDLFSSVFNESGRRDLPFEICFYSKDDGDYRGDRICNNALANAIVSILVAVALMMVDLLIPCLNSSVGINMACSNKLINKTVCKRIYAVS